jgi:hypothetical protein
LLTGRPYPPAEFLFPVFNALAFIFSLLVFRRMKRLIASVSVEKRDE